MILGITGNIGSGKSTAAAIFERYGFRVVDADKIGHKLLERGTKQYHELVNIFGVEILDEKNNIIRQRLGEAAFSEKKKYKALNFIMISPIIKEMKNHIINSANKNIAVDAALLLETKAKELVDKVIIVKTSPPNILKRNKRFSKEMVQRVKYYQMPLAEKLKHADYVLNNDVNIKSLENQIKNIITNLK